MDDFIKFKSQATCVTPKGDGGIKSVYLCNWKDFVFEGNKVVRKKRVYGKFKRPVLKVES
jgi:hypothetical protein